MTLHNYANSFEQRTLLGPSANGNLMNYRLRPSNKIEKIERVRIKIDLFVGM